MSHPITYSVYNRYGLAVVSDNNSNERFTKIPWSSEYAQSPHGDPPWPCCASMSGKIKVKYTGPHPINPDVLARNFDIPEDCLDEMTSGPSSILLSLCVLPIPFIIYRNCCMTPSKSEKRAALVNKEIDIALEAAQKQVTERIANIAQPILNAQNTSAANDLTLAMAFVRALRANQDPQTVPLLEQS